MLGIELAGGVLVFMVFAIVFVLALSVALYTRRGSAIGQHPYRRAYGGAPAASHESRMTGSADREVVMWTRGTR
jgi:hypothetical protein